MINDKAELKKGPGVMVELRRMMKKIAVERAAINQVKSDDRAQEHQPVFIEFTDKIARSLYRGEPRARIRVLEEG